MALSIKHKMKPVSCSVRELLVVSVQVAGGRCNPHSPIMSSHGYVEL